MFNSIVLISSTMASQDKGTGPVPGCPQGASSSLLESIHHSRQAPAEKRIVEEGFPIEGKQQKSVNIPPHDAAEGSSKEEDQGGGGNEPLQPLPVVEKWWKPFKTGSPWTVQEGSPCLVTSLQGRNASQKTLSPSHTYPSHLAHPALWVVADHSRGGVYTED